MEQFSELEQAIIRLAFDIGTKAEEGFGNRTGTFSSQSDDVQYAADEACEQLIFKWAQRQWLTHPQLALFTEDLGFKAGDEFDESREAQYLMIDPLDGSRPWAVGLRLTTCCGVLTSGAGHRDPEFSEIEFAFVHTLSIPPVIFGWKRGFGLFKADNYAMGNWNTSSEHGLRPSTKSDLKGAFIGVEHYGVAPQASATIITPLYKAGVNEFFEFMSIGRQLLSVATGGLDAVIDVRPYLNRAMLRTKTAGMLDVAATVMILEAVGGIVTDVEGNPLTDYQLFDRKENKTVPVSIIAAGNTLLWDVMANKVQEALSPA